MTAGHRIKLQAMCMSYLKSYQNTMRFRSLQAWKIVYSEATKFKQNFKQSRNQSLQ